MKLIVTTPSGACFILAASPTGDIDLCADGFTVASIAVLVWAVCARLHGTGPEELPGPDNGCKRVWVRPQDLCDDNGTPFKHEELIYAAETAREARERQMLNGPLGDNWP